MFLSILDYRTGEVVCVEVKSEVKDTDTYVHDLVGHSDYHYMSTDNLIIKIDEEDSPNIQIITKLKQ